MVESLIGHDGWSAHVMNERKKTRGEVQQGRGGWVGGRTTTAVRAWVGENCGDLSAAVGPKAARGLVFPVVQTKQCHNENRHSRLFLFSAYSGTLSKTAWLACLH